MGLTLNFKVIPSGPYHTLHFHMNRAVKQKLHESQAHEEVWAPFISELSAALKIMIQIPDHFSICLLPSKIYFSVILQHLFPPAIHLIPAHPSITHPYYKGLTYSGMYERILLPDIQDPDLRRAEAGGMLARDADLIGGYSANFQELFLLKENNPGIQLFLDVSISMANHPLAYEKIDGYLFNTEFVFGLQPGIVVLIIRDFFFELIREKWKGEFYSTEIFTDHDHPAILCHREIEPVKLFVVKEMVNDLIRRDLKIIRNEIIYKSILISNALENNEAFELLVKNEAVRIPNIISAKILGSTDEVRSHFSRSGIQMDEIHLENYGNILRFGNFPVHSKEQAGYLADCIASFR